MALHFRPWTEVGDGVMGRESWRQTRGPEGRVIRRLQLPNVCVGDSRYFRRDRTGWDKVEWKGAKRHIKLSERAASCFIKATTPTSFFTVMEEWQRQCQWSTHTRSEVLFLLCSSALEYGLCAVEECFCNVKYIHVCFIKKWRKVLFGGKTEQVIETDWSDLQTGWRWGLGTSEVPV